MPMMDIREMRMGVSQLLVFMFMDMAGAPRGRRMAMGVVAVVTLVPVFVFFQAMDMPVKMSSDEKSGQRYDEKQRRHHLDRPELVSQYQNR
jgi:hypothetical protein